VMVVDSEEVSEIIKEHPEYTVRDENGRIEELVAKFTGEYGKSIKEGKGSLSDFSREVIDFIDGKSKVVPENVRKIIEKITKRGLANMTNESLMRIIADLYAIRKYGRTAQMAKEYDRKVKNEAIAGRIRDEIKAPPELTAAEKTPEYEKKKKRFDWMKSYGYALMSAEQIIEKVAGKNSVLMEKVFKPMYLAARNEITAKKGVKKFLEETYGKQIAEMRTAPYMSVVVQDENGKEIRVPLTVEQAMHWYAYSVNPHQREWLLASISENRESAEAQLDTVIAGLDPKYKDMVKAQWDYYASNQYDRMNPVYRREHNTDMPQSSYYMPLGGLGGTRSFVDDDVEVRKSRPGTQKGMTISRTDAVRKMAHYRYFDTIIPNMMASEHYIAFNDAVKDVASVMSNEGVTKKLEAHSEYAKKNLEDWVKTMATGKVEQNDDGLSKMIYGLTQIFAAYQLGLKATTWALQLTALPRGLAYTPRKYGLQAVGEAVRNHKKMFEAIDALSPFMETRTDNWDMAVTEWREHEEMKKIFNEKNFGAGYRAVKDFFMDMIGYLDKKVAGVVWYAKYLEVMDKTGNQEKAVYAADKAVRDTQQGGGLINSSKFERGPIWTKAFTQFMSENRKTLQMVYDYAQQFKNMDNKQRASVMAMAFIAPNVVAWFVRNGLKPDDPEEIINQSVQTVTSGLPMIGSVVGVGMQAVFDKGVEFATGIKKERPKYETRPSYAPAFTSIFDAYAKLIEDPTVQNAIDFGLIFVPAGKQFSRAINAGRIILEEDKAKNITEEGNEKLGKNEPVETSGFKRRLKYFVYSERSANKDWYFIKENIGNKNENIRNKARKMKESMSPQEKTRYNNFVTRLKMESREKSMKKNEEQKK
jgi:hypothetical protein